MSRPPTMPIPDGPCLLYVAQDGTTTLIDQDPLTDRRNRRMARGLVSQALELFGEADEADKTRAKLPVGFQPPSVGVETGRP